MKRRSVPRFSSATLDIPTIVKTLPRIGINPITTKQPSEELVKRLNRIGQEYPFCVYYKHKNYDPL